MRNMEKTWLAEQAAEKEKQKLEQLRKEKQQERALEDLQDLQNQTSKLVSPYKYIVLILFYRKKKEQLDWMYSGTSTSASNVQEEYLLGKRKIHFQDAPMNSSKNSEMLSSNTSIWKASSAVSDRDLESKAREDPLMMIKKREMEVIKRAVNNPLRPRPVNTDARIRTRPERSDNHRSDRSEHSEDRDRQRSAHREFRHSHVSSSGGGQGRISKTNRRY